MAAGSSPPSRSAPPASAAAPPPPQRGCWSPLASSLGNQKRSAPSRRGHSAAHCVLSCSGIHHATVCSAQLYLLLMLIDHLGRSKYQQTCVQASGFAPGEGTRWLGEEEFDPQLAHDLCWFIW